MATILSIKEIAFLVNESVRAEFVVWVALWYNVPRFQRVYIRRRVMIQVASVSVTSPEFQTKLARHRAFLRRAEAGSLLRSSGVFAASVPVRLPQPDGSSVVRAERLEPSAVDPIALVDEFEAWSLDRADAVEISQRQTIALLGIGDLLPLSQPFFKVPWLEAMLGCPIKMTEGQIWVERYQGDVDRLSRRGVYVEDSPWFELYVAFLRVLRERLAGQFPVSPNTLLRGPSDLVANLMGVQEACVGWIEQPDLMARLMRVCTDANLALIEIGNQSFTPVAGGCVSGFGIWSPAPVVRMQADHSSLLSPGMYERQILPYDLEVVRAAPVCMFHIHNNGLHVAPHLVHITELDVVQVVVDPYPVGERKRYEIEMLQMIQEHKPLLLDVNLPSRKEAEWFLGQLSPRGLCLNARFAPETLESAPRDLSGDGFWVLS
jgi:hypothetical protein